LAPEAIDRSSWLLGTMGRTAFLIAAVLLPLVAVVADPRAAAAPADPSSPAQQLDELYAARGGVPLWTGDGGAAARRAVMLALLVAEKRADPAGADTPALAAAFARLAPSDQRAAERELSRAALGYLARRNGGEPVPPARALKALRPLDGADPAAPLAAALTQLLVVRELGGWRAVGTVPGPPPTAEPLALVSPEVDVAPAFPKRQQVPEVGALRRRLVQSADLSATYLEGEETDAHLVDAVRRFQQRHGLAPDGVVGARTLAELNAPIAGDVAQVRLNLARPQADRSRLPRYVEVNVPGYELRLIEHGRPVLRSRVIVGEEDSPTPIFADRIRTVELNPSWYVPRSIALELLEKEERKPGYLAANDFYWKAASAPGASDRLIQRPGPKNALGRVKFLFPNHHAVYLHDTPERAAFGRSRRGLSHGCVRVEKWRELAAALLAPEGWTAARLEQALAAGRTRRVDLAAPVPVFLDYRTAYVDDLGRLNLRADLYGHDRTGVTTFDGPAAPVETAPMSDAGPPPPARATVRIKPVPPPLEPAAASAPAGFLDSSSRPSLWPSL
jgi:hypothetical protein